MREIPLTVKRSIELLGLGLLGTIFVIGSNIIMPVIMAFFISIMLVPIYRFLRKYKCPEILAIILPILMVAVFVGLIVWFFSAQVGQLAADFPQIKKNVSMHLKSLSEWFGQITHYSTSEQMDFINKKSNDLLNMAGGMASGAAVTLSSVFVFVGLLPIYIYLILFYKDILLRFIFMWFKPDHHPKVKEAIYETESIIKSYLVGLLIQVTYMTILLGGLLLLFGIKHALLIGIIFALLNLIPYVGALIGNILGVLLTLTASTSLTPVITVLAVIAAVQFLDNNILMPRIVGSKVKINALMAILGVIVGGSMAGVSGMFLSMPIIAVLKIIFDRTEMFRQWGVLFGDERPAKSPMKIPSFRKKKPVPTEPGVQKDI
ncbi:AI-2E family transporter [Pedobacter antarcticus]|uniref:Permease n=2 Tax=Pedobacter antarcticus TaxID=34086 RepID=A0A081PC77_9SPHI|nr:AI-2E family transporter [Pedobacter antarcticus]KEQ28300.1 permease [Pedobacter antarcticus 4BY]SDL37450.1 Predicted PurR-regulated permease PerM [Pedobacter antarcticus]SFE48125.1 Predicted PurR-regulated permease PerM [Pedobacter antarcticus]